MQKLKSLERLKGDLLNVLNVEALVVVRLNEVIQALSVEFKHQARVFAVTAFVRNVGELVL